MANTGTTTNRPARRAQLRPLPPLPRRQSSPARSRWKAHLLTFAVTVLVVWGVGASAYIYFFPRLPTTGWRTRSSARHRRQRCPLPFPSIRSIRSRPSPPPRSPTRWRAPENRDTLYTVGWLDLSKGPEVLHVPDMAGRYYVVQFTDPWGTDFAYVGRRTTGTQAGDYLISGPGWQGTMPNGSDEADRRAEQHGVADRTHARGK